MWNFILYSANTPQMIIPKKYTRRNFYGDRRTIETFLPNELVLYPGLFDTLPYLRPRSAHHFSWETVFTREVSSKLTPGVVTTLTLTNLDQAGSCRFINLSEGLKNFFSLRGETYIITVLS